MTVGIVAAVVVVVLVAWFIMMYNGLVKLRNNRENAFANIDVQLKQRFDLVPQLVNTIKGYASHEKETLEKVTAARAAAMSATTVCSASSAPPCTRRQKTARRSTRRPR